MVETGWDYGEIEPDDLPANLYYSDDPRYSGY
jgi:hypothetical protein